MQPIEIIVIIISIIIVILPIVLKILNKNKGQCKTGCDLCNKNCAKRILEQIDINEN